MRWVSGKFKYRWIWLILVAVFGLSQSTDAFASGLIYKNYIVRYDRGWDILCEPYVVQKSDWLSKIFHQKGEIAYKDFYDFLGIFKRLNPHVRDIDLIRPGQGIDIPLRKLEQRDLTGQSSGVVTIPFVTLHDVSQVIKQHSTLYTVQKGDMVSNLIARKYGRYESKSYREGLKLFKAANPQVANLELIYPGQKLHIPDPTIRLKSWYAGMYDDQGNLRAKFNQNPAPTPLAATPETTPQQTGVTSLEPEKLIENLVKVADYLGGELKAKGTYYLLRQGGKDFEIELSQHPLLTFGKGLKLVFTSNGQIMDMDKDSFQASWPEIMPVSIESKSTTEQYVAAIFEVLKEDRKHADELVIENQGVNIAIRSKYVRSENEGRQLCITPIATADQMTPESIRRYLEQNGVVIKEILPGGTASGLNHGDQKHRVNKKRLVIMPTSQKDFVQKLSDTLGFSYIPNTTITFPYANIQVKAYANLISTNTGRETVVDFGDLYGDAVTAIRRTGLNVVQIMQTDSHDTIAEKLLSALSIKFKHRPTLLAARRPAKYNTAITINGLLCDDDYNRRTLLTSASLHSAVTDMLNNCGIDVVVW
jgi:LysM repeat protein